MRARYVRPLEMEIEAAGVKLEIARLEYADEDSFDPVPHRHRLKRRPEVVFFRTAQG